ncbi:hypothetical protein HYFRA_00005742 [Hymenoscyphus fraxineus]|uniref:Major facilitator superfamily (MFS) profile domain-containing protein n=1 Tax=Hymenoscyphus fraxineus TaxID=746836 RepID=A0A9N9PM49_9HELO|nr:hypothetical protein HYFRA_00005742 [Hymenoscyphus fraxineus]
MSTSTSTTTGPEKEQMSSGTALVNQSRDEPQAEIAPPAFKPGFQFWTIMAGLSATSLMASLENSAFADLSSFFSAAVQPLFGQLCNIFGRRWLMLSATALFTLGSGICGGAVNGSMLIAGRAVQGAGSGGVVMIVHVILADMVPLRQRGYYLAIIVTFYGLGLTLGPFIGGAMTLVPLFLGLLSLILFAAWETKGFSSENTGLIPPRLFRHCTSKIVAINTFLHWMLVYWSLYFLPIYFQSVALYSAQKTGVSILPMSLVAIPGSIIAAMAVSRWGRFKIIHIVGEAIFTLGSGLMSLQDENTTVAEWATFQSVGAIGGGIVLDTLLPAFQAPVPESDQAAATATWAFIRTIGGVWGVAIPAAVMNNRVDKLVYTISDPRARELLIGGGAYQHATADFVNSFPEPVRSEIRAVYREALKLVFLVAVAFGGFACVLFFFEKDVILRKDLETEYGIVDSDVKESGTASPKRNRLPENVKAAE